MLVCSTWLDAQHLMTHAWVACCNGVQCNLHECTDVYLMFGNQAFSFPPMALLLAPLQHALLWQLIA